MFHPAAEISQGCCYRRQYDVSLCAVCGVQKESRGGRHCYGNTACSAQSAQSADLGLSNNIDTSCSADRRSLTTCLVYLVADCMSSLNRLQARPHHSPATDPPPAAALHRYSWRPRNPVCTV